MEGCGGRKRRLVKIWRQTQEGKRVLRRTLDMTQERDASGRGKAAILAENWPTHVREPLTAVMLQHDFGNKHKAYAAPSSVRRPRNLKLHSLQQSAES